MTENPFTGGPTEAFYDDLRGLSLLVKASWYEAQAFPNSANEIFDRLNAEVRRLAGGAEVERRREGNDRR